MTMMIAIARESGVSAYVGDGLNVWPAGHRFDTAHLYRLALEKAPAGSTLHAVAEEGVNLKDIAEVIGRQPKVTVESKTAEEAHAHFGSLGMVSPISNPVSSKKTREEMGWNPKQCTLLEDLENGQYFKN
jgi:nucleoside-diphosphate-sugar epimerase